MANTHVNKAPQGSAEVSICWLGPGASSTTGSSLPNIILLKEPGHTLYLLHQSHLCRSISQEMAAPLSTHNPGLGGILDTYQAVVDLARIVDSGWGNSSSEYRGFDKDFKAYANILARASLSFR